MYDNFNPYMGNYMQRMNNQPQVQQHQIVHVNGENGAKAFRMMPNSQCLLLDDTASIIWLCQSDGAGYHTVTPYSITPYQQPQEIDYRTVLASFDERLKKLEGNYESNTTAVTGQTAKQSNANDTGVQPVQTPDGR